MFNIEYVTALLTWGNVIVFYPPFYPLMANKRKPINVVLNQEAIKFCFREGYIIYPITKDGVNFQIQMNLAHQTAIIEDVHTSTTIHQAICDLYEKIYLSKRKDN